MFRNVELTRPARGSIVSWVTTHPINTIVVVAVTSNLRLAAMPGNVRLAKGEAGLRRASLVNVSQIATIDRTTAVERIGSVSVRRLREIWEGVRLVIEPPSA